MRNTLWTPTYNRARFLPRLYESVKNQTFKDFEWLIIDDGSTDDTKEVVQSFIDEGVVRICYVYKENGGKHTAMKLAYDICNTPYISSVDSDEELLPKAMELWENAWIDIETSGKNDVARVCLFCQNEDGSCVGFGNYSLPRDVPYVEETWHELVLHHGCHRELAGSLCLKKFHECCDFDNYTWHSDTNRFLGESILWSALGRKYKTRLVNGFSNVYHIDADDSLMRAAADKRKLLNEMVNNFYFVDENMSFFWWNPKYFIAAIGRYVIFGKMSGTDFSEQHMPITNHRFKIMHVLLYLPFILSDRIGLIKL